MPDPRRPSFPSFVRLPPARVAGGGAVLAIGSRGVLGAEQGGGSVPLKSDDGLTVVTTLGAGAEVEIVAWRPRRGGSTTYCVRPTSGGTEGWLEATNLRPYPVPRPARKAPAAAAAAPTRPAKRRTTR